MGHDLFGQQVVELMPNVLVFAMHLCKDPFLAEDLAQDTALKALAHRDQFREGSNLAAWLFTICRHRFYTLHRNRKRREFWVEDHIYEGASSGYSLSDEVEARQQLLKIFSTVKEPHRTTLTRLALGDDYADLQAIFQINDGTVKSRVFRAREFAAAAVGGEVIKQKPVHRKKKYYQRTEKWFARWERRRARSAMEKLNGAPV